MSDLKDRDDHAWPHLRSVATGRHDMTETIQLTEEQQFAADNMVEMLTCGKALQLSVGGYAGTGKTSVVRFVLERLPRPKNNIVVCAFTGKAVSVLRRKGVYQAQTLHSLMYSAQEDPVTKQLTFRKKNRLGDEDGPPYTGVIVDEASMLNTTLYDDLLSYGLPVVFVGDHGQLEPIGDNPNVMAEPDIRLETIHRQASGSPILKLAHAFREGAPVNWASVPPGCGIAKTTRQRLDPKLFDVMLCGFNKTRHRLNDEARMRFGRTEPVEVGERLICLKNNRQRGVFNGQMFTVTDVLGEKAVTNTEGTSYLLTEVEAVDDAGVKRKMEFYLTSPTEEVNKIVTKYWGSGDYPSDFIVCDYGYAITVHKSQGSEWPRVAVVEEIWAEKWDTKRWRYTAATRASENLVWVV